MIAANTWRRLRGAVGITLGCAATLLMATPDAAQELRPVGRTERSARDAAAFAFQGPLQDQAVNFSANNEALASGDLDGDGDLDIVSLHGNRLTIVFNSGLGSFAGRADNLVSISNQSTAMALGDIDGDSLPDVVFTGVFGASVRLNRGDGSLRPPTAFGILAPGATPMLGDMDLDGRTDIVTTTFIQAFTLNSGGVTVLLQDPGLSGPR